MAQSWGGRRRGSAAGDVEAPVLTGVVTAIAPAPRREGRWEVALDGKPVGVVSIDVVEQLGLRVGRVVGAGEAPALADALGAVAAYDQALRMLALRGRSSWDLRRRLVQRGTAPAHADAALARLAEAGLVDDEAYARQVARSRVTGRGESRRGVAQALAQVRVPREVADAAVAEVFEDEAVNEVILMEDAARKRLRSLGGLDPVTRRRRLFGYLMRRGYDGATIRDVLGRVLGSGGAECESEGGDNGDGDPAEES